MRAQVDSNSASFSFLLRFISETLPKSNLSMLNNCNIDKIVHIILCTNNINAPYIAIILY